MSGGNMDILRTHLYECDPEKNDSCKKTGCHIHNGECYYTTHEQYRKDGTESLYIFDELMEAMDKIGNQG